MAAPSGTVWGSIVGSYGKIGIYKSLSNTETTTTVTVEIWFWSKYSVSDSGNTLYYNNLASAGSATTSVGAVAVNTTVASGDGWSTSNQIKLKSYSYSYTRGTSAVTRYLYAKLADIDRVGGTMYASTTFSVPKLSSYTVSYNANGGSGAPSSQTKWYGKALTLSSAKPTRTGYTFKGWATSASGSVAYASGASYTSNAAVTLYAVWQANTYTVKYDANGGSGAPGNQTKTYGTTLKLSSTKPTRTNYTFKGWGTSASATTVAYAAGANYTTNAGVTLYAVWELAYVKPRISGFSVSRCDATGTEADEGTYALVKFDWECDKTVSSIVVTWKDASDAETTATISASGTSGSVSTPVGSGSLSTEKTYTFTVTVTDGGGYMTAIGTLNGAKFTLDFLAGGNGAAFGKPAELQNVLDIAFQTRMLGGILPPILEPETDLNDVRTPNTYTGANISHNAYANCPVTSGTFTLIVESCGEDGQVKQTYISCSKYKPERFSRFYYQSEWGAWFWASTDEYVLYENASGTNGTITLSASASHYRYIEIYFTDNNGKSGGYTKVYSPNGKTVSLQITEPSSTIYSRQTFYTISGTAMTPDVTTASYYRITSAGAVSTSIGTNYIKIIRVIGRA